MPNKNDEEKAKETADYWIFGTSTAAPTWNGAA
jgi:hypothetical protein